MGSTDGAKKKALVLCSGGGDSTTLLALAVERYGAERTSMRFRSSMVKNMIVS